MVAVMVALWQGWAVVAAWTAPPAASLWVLGSRRGSQESRDLCPFAVRSGTQCRATGARIKSRVVPMAAGPTGSLGKALREILAQPFSLRCCCLSGPVSSPEPAAVWVPTGEGPGSPAALRPPSTHPGSNSERLPNSPNPRAQSNCTHIQRRRLRPGEGHCSCPRMLASWGRSQPPGTEGRNSHPWWGAGVHLSTAATADRQAPGAGGHGERREPPLVGYLCDAGRGTEMGWCPRRPPLQRAAENAGTGPETAACPSHALELPAGVALVPGPPSRGGL